LITKTLTEHCSCSRGARRYCFWKWGKWKH